MQTADYARALFEAWRSGSEDELDRQRIVTGERIREGRDWLV